jgi:hypothetical protein
MIFVTHIEFIRNEKFYFSHNVAATSSIPVEDLSLKTLKSLVDMTTFENLVPRYTALVPIFWTEIQQEQQQRRHPQHLLQNSQGDASCHTRTWRLQKKGYVTILSRLHQPRSQALSGDEVAITSPSYILSVYFKMLVQ